MATNTTTTLNAFLTTPTKTPSGKSLSQTPIPKFHSRERHVVFFAGLPLQLQVPIGGQSDCKSMRHSGLHSFELVGHKEESIERNRDYGSQRENWDANLSTG